jgi:DNA-binding NtrC family response regulator
VNHFLQKHKKENQPRAKKISFHALESLLVYPWPGNVGELESVIERAVILAEGETIHQEDLPQEVLRTSTSHPSCSFPAIIVTLSLPLCFPKAIRQSRVRIRARFAINLICRV